MSSLKKKRSQKSGKDQTLNALKTFTKRGLAAGALATITSVWATKAINAFSSDNVKPEEVKALDELSQGYVHLYNSYLFGNEAPNLHLKVDMFAGSASTILRNRFTDKNKDLTEAQKKLVAKYITNVKFFKVSTSFELTNRNQALIIDIYKNYNLFEINQDSNKAEMEKLLKHISITTDPTHVKDDEYFTVYKFPDCVMLSNKSDKSYSQKANINYILVELKKKTDILYCFGIKNDFPNQISISFVNCDEYDDARIERLLNMLEEEKKMENLKQEMQHALNLVGKELPLVQ